MNFDPAEIEKIVREVIQQTRSQVVTASPTPLSSVRPEIRSTSQPSAIPVRARAAVLVEKKRLELKEFPLRKIRENEILVRVEGCGICGTDIHCFNNDPFKLCPVVLGHEGTGEVIEVGSAIHMDSVGKPVRPGDKIVTSVLETSEACMVAKYNPAKANLCDDSAYLWLAAGRVGQSFQRLFWRIPHYPARIFFLCR
jgi:L-iditol 2-dehydrogenase